MKFIIGQRWASNAETHLGLGIIVEVAHRRVAVSFPAIGETRTYAADTAPLTRIRYLEKDQITDMDDQSFTIMEIVEHDGLITYICTNAAGETTELQEYELNCFVQFTTPQQRLFSNQLDKNSAFELRVKTLEHAQRLQQSEARGLLGSRTSLLPHQIYIANEVAKRHAPRVLLADEVGLGKTIEAGLILHYQLHTGQASRVLILVPDSLVHQWLVEMLRRFNLSFSIFDKSRMEAMLSEDDQETNPFESEQTILCSTSFLTDNPLYQELALAADWDLVVVDEAHHLHWSTQEVSKEYLCVEQLAHKSAGLLLLTATPEQVGIDGHFARLRLLDPARFHDLETFKAEEANYQALNDLVQSISEYAGEQNIAQAMHQELAGYLGDELKQNPTKDKIIASLLDRHGTGRVLFRNTRAAVQGFPSRNLNAYPLACPEIYTNRYGESSLFPEQAIAGKTWLSTDPRVEWLTEKLKALAAKKVLLICHHANTAIALNQHLQQNAAIASSVFHEGLSIIERDRAAAYFADAEDGAQILVCSEIGSEGRNFQFAHHLVLFDLPTNPDLIEQRIGRLDRIGQLHDIQIHVPYLKDTAQEILFQWFQDGLDLFTQSCAAGYAIYEKFSPRLQEQLSAPEQATFTKLVRETAEYKIRVTTAQQAGRDRLLELNSCRPEIADTLIDAILEEEQSAELANYMDRVFDHFGVEHEFHSDQALIIRPSDNMHAEHFPGLKAEGNTITYSRSKGLMREDMEFLSWEHPMVAESMEMILSGETGNASIATISTEQLKPGTLLLETYFTVQAVAPKHLQLDRYLPLHPTRLLIDVLGRDLGSYLTHEYISKNRDYIKVDIAKAVIEQVRVQVETMLEHAQATAGKKHQVFKADAQTALQNNLGQELQRLRALQKVNPIIRDDEIEFANTQIKSCEEIINRTTMQLQAVRLLINN